MNSRVRESTEGCIVAPGFSILRTSVALLCKSDEFMPLVPVPQLPRERLAVVEPGSMDLQQGSSL